MRVNNFSDIAVVVVVTIVITNANCNTLFFLNVAVISVVYSIRIVMMFS